MTISQSQLANGLRIVSHHMQHLGTVALGIWVGAGARHESSSEHGISHLIEHMAFKGTARRSARDIVEEIERVGGDLNAATSLDTTAFYARVLKEDVALALDILADIMLNPAYDPNELDREREVILQEIAATQDSPDDIVFDLLQDAAFPDQALGRPILGTRKSVSSFRPDHLRRFRAQRYRPEDMVISAAGFVDHATLVRHAEALFGALSGPERIDPEPARYVGGIRSSPRRFEQAHVVMGYEGPANRDPAFYAVQVLSGLFGGGMSSRLFQEVREKRGLCYSIYSSAWGLGDTGLFSMHAATGPETAAELVDVVHQQFQRIAAEQPAAAEVTRAKAQLKAGLLIGLESASARAEQMARQLQTHGRLMSTEELIERVDSVTAEDVRAIAERVVTGSRLAFAVAGMGKSAGPLVSRIEQLGRVA